MLAIKIKKLREGAVIPQYAKEGDAGMDLVAVDITFNPVRESYTYHSGVAVEIPEGYVGLLFPRSSNAKTNYYLTNSVGVIDSGYRGEIMAVFKHRDRNAPYKIPYEIGERFAQLVIIPYPKVNFIEVEELSTTVRGAGGYGSSGK